eukprot:gene942-256_t
MVQSNEVGGSAYMELEGLKRCLETLELKELNFCTLVTDHHSQIRKYMRTKHSKKMHYFDVFHVAKGNGNLIEEKWTSLLSHLINKHDGHGQLFKSGQHGPVKRNWLKSGGLLLAALHFNENAERQQAKSKAGKQRWKVSYPKYKSGPIAKSLKTKPTLVDYVSTLLKAAIQLRQSNTRYMTAKRNMESMSSSVPPSLASTKTRVYKDAVVLARKSRFAAARVYDQAIPSTPEPDPQTHKKRRKNKK